MTRVRGEFTRYQARRERERIASLDESIAEVQAVIDRAEQERSEGTAEKEARGIASFIRYDLFKSLVSRLNEAESTYSDAKKALNRCRFDRDDPSTASPTAKRRIREAARAKRACLTVYRIFKDYALRFGVEIDFVDLGSPPKKGRLQTLKEMLRERVELVRVDDRDVMKLRELKRQRKKSLLRLEAMEGSLVSEKTIRRFALYLNPYERKLLCLLESDERKPPKKKIPNPIFTDLASLGVISHGSWTVTDLGRDVVEWIHENTRESFELCDTARDEVKDMFTAKQLQTMVKEGREALRYLELNGDQDGFFELGVPKDGFSYRINKTAIAVKLFLGQLCSKPERRVKLRMKKPMFTPGEIVIG